MIENIYKNSYKFIGNPAKNLIKEARKTIAESNKEFGFERVALDLAAAENSSVLKFKLKEIAEWHRRCAIEKLAEAVAYLRRAERCALTMKFRRYATMRLKKYELDLKRFEKTGQSIGENETEKSIGIKTFLKNLSAKAALVLSMF